MRRSLQEQVMTPGAALREHSSSITDPSQTLQQKVGDMSGHCRVRGLHEPETGDRINMGTIVFQLVGGGRPE